jgi:hypothetical protein
MVAFVGILATLASGFSQDERRRSKRLIESRVVESWGHPRTAVSTADPKCVRFLRGSGQGRIGKARLRWGKLDLLWPIAQTDDLHAYAAQLGAAEKFILCGDMYGVSPPAPEVLRARVSRNLISFSS